MPEQYHVVVEVHSVKFGERSSGFKQCHNFHRLGVFYLAFAGNLFVLFPGEWHNYAPYPEIGWQEHWIGFYGSDMDKRVKTGFFTPNQPIFDIGISDEIIQLYDKATLVSQQQCVGYQQLLAGIINMLMSNIYSANKQQNFQDRQIVCQINLAKKIMLENLERKISGEEIATAVGMGYSRFRKLFREYTGFAPSQYILELKMTKSKYLLTNTSMTCQEIAYASGFETPPYFNIVFRKRTGMTPIEYRQMTQGKYLRHNHISVQ